MGELLVQFWASSIAHYILQEHFLVNYFPKTHKKACYAQSTCSEILWIQVHHHTMLVSALLMFLEERVEDYHNKKINRGDAYIITW